MCHKIILFCILFVWGLPVQASLQKLPSLEISSSIVEPNAGRAPLIDAIDAAKQSIFITMYGFTDEQLLEHLASARARGVQVEVLIQVQPYQGGNENNYAIQYLRKHDITVRDSNPYFKFTHQKSMVIDGKLAIIMTFNFVRSSFAGERNFAVVTHDPAVAQEILHVFAADVKRQSPHLHHPLLAWSPHNIRARLNTLIDSANYTLDIYAMEIGDYGFEDKLFAALHRGVRVKIISSAMTATKYSQIFKQLADAGAQIRYDDKDLIHVKAIVVDGGVKNASAYIGSANFSKTSLDENRELGVITYNLHIIKELSGVFSQDWSVSK